MIWTLLILGGLLAFANGANDNAKGVATLVGFGAARPRQALAWAALTTAIGASVSFWLSSGLVATFSTALFNEGTPFTAHFFAAVLAASFLWIVAASFFGMPVSTTHAIAGALVGAGLMSFKRSQVHWEQLRSALLLPLILSPLLSTLLVYLAAGALLAILRRHSGSGHPSTSAVDAAAIPGGSTVTALHWFSSGLVSFARGWNDAPKIAALSAAALALCDVPHATVFGFAIVIIAMTLGGILAGRPVLQTLACKLTPLPLASSMAATIFTASVVGLASFMDMPVSTTHVSTGAIIGAGLKNNPRAVSWAKVGEIFFAWTITLPISAILAAGISIYLVP